MGASLVSDTIEGFAVAREDTVSPPCRLSIDNTDALNDYQSSAPLSTRRVLLTNLATSLDSQ